MTLEVDLPSPYPTSSSVLDVGDVVRYIEGMINMSDYENKNCGCGGDCGVCSISDCVRLSGCSHEAQDLRAHTD